MGEGRGRETVEAECCCVSTRGFVRWKGGRRALYFIDGSLTYYAVANKINGLIQTKEGGYLTAAEHVLQKSSRSSHCAVWRGLACFAQCTSEDLFFIFLYKGWVMHNESDWCFLCNVQLIRIYIDLTLWAWGASFSRSSLTFIWTLRCYCSIFLVHIRPRSLHKSFFIW